MCGSIIPGVKKRTIRAVVVTIALSAFALACQDSTAPPIPQAAFDVTGLGIDHVQLPLSNRSACADLGTLLGFAFILEIKVDMVGATSSGGVTINVTVSGSTFSWTVSGAVIGAVVVKGGPVDPNVYNYLPGGALGDTGLHAPDNSNNGRRFGLSHASFCVKKLK